MKTKNQKGITLIALIITIIVMMILVAVSVSIALNNGLFNAAQDATKKTRNELDHENTLSNGGVTVNGKEWPSMDAYIQSLKGESGTGSGTVTDPEGEDPIPTTIAVGDIVAYTPTQASHTVNLAGCTGTFTTEDLGEWKVLSVSGDEIRIMPKKATTATLTIEGANGWNNSIDAINGVCGALYGNTESNLYTATATSLTVEDINKIAGYQPSESTETYSPSNYGGNNKFPTEYLKENGITYSDVTDGYATSTSTNKFIKETYYSYTVETRTNFNDKFAGWVDIDKAYWLASRCVGGSSYNAYFAVRSVASWGDVHYDRVFVSTVYADDPSYAVRPVVTLTPKVTPVYEKTVGEGEEAINYWKFE